MYMEKNAENPLEILNQLNKEMDEIYHSYAKDRDVSDSALWLMYSIYESSVPCTQKDLCAAWHYPPQTVNSILKGLEKNGYVTLETTPENHKNKLIFLTKQGRKLLKEVIAPLIHAEEQAFQYLTKEEQAFLLNLTRKYIESLRKEVSRIYRD